MRIDDEWNIISEWTYRRTLRYKKLEKQFATLKAGTDRQAIFDNIIERNWLAHRIAEESWNDKYEKAVYVDKNDYAKEEIKLRWPDVIKIDKTHIDKNWNPKPLPYLEMPDWSNWFHVDWKIKKRADKIRNRQKKKAQK